MISAPASEWEQFQRSQITVITFPEVVRNHQELSGHWIATPKCKYEVAGKSVARKSVYCPAKKGQLPST